MRLRKTNPKLKLNITLCMPRFNHTTSSYVYMGYNIFVLINIIVVNITLQIYVNAAGATAKAVFQKGFFFLHCELLLFENDIQFTRREQNTHPHTYN